jgi:exopolysaccharide biosynthesis WecB/TagA/CpsF family protein
MTLLQDAERSAAPVRKRPGAPVRDIAGVSVAALSGNEALARVHAALVGQAPPLRLAFCNAHVVNVAARDAGFRAALSRMLVLADGVGVDIGSRLLHGAAFPANLNGTDFIPSLIASAPAPLSIGLFGAAPGVAERAAAKLAALDGRHSVAVLGHGFVDAAGSQALLARLRERPVDLLLVALGNPLQEKWIDANICSGEARVAAAVGALFDFLAGEVPRAPDWLRRLRLEWLFRLALEPGRLWRRYVLGNPAFLLRVLAVRLKEFRKPAP